MSPSDRGDIDLRVQSGLGSVDAELDQTELETLYRSIGQYLKAMRKKKS